MDPKHEIQQKFKEMGLGTQAERDRFRKFVIWGMQDEINEQIVIQITAETTEEEDNGKLE
jgi:hypothetical protein